MVNDYNLLFICGFPSGGTDLLKNIVNAHSNVNIAGEFPNLYTLAGKYGSKISNKKRKDVQNLIINGDVYNHIENRGFDFNKGHISLAEIYYKILPGDKNLKWKGNKTPQNTEHIEELNYLFPEAKFILIVRDVRDVALSWRKKWGKDEILCAHKWAKRMSKGKKTLSQLKKDRYLILKYEDILKNLEVNAKKICELLNLKFQKRMLEFHKYVENIVNGKINYGKPLRKDNYGKWKKRMSPDKIQRIEQIAYETIQEFGYEIDIAERKKNISLIDKCLGYINDLYAILFIGNRKKKKNTILDRVKTISIEFKKRLKNK